MQLKVVVPFKHKGAKSRLSGVLSDVERDRLACAMLDDVLDVVCSAGSVTLIVRPGFNECSVSAGRFDLVESPFDLNDALNSFLDRWSIEGWPSPVLIAMSDLALITKADVEGIVGTSGDVVLSPGRGGGTNMMLIRSPLFRTCYWGLSFLNHLLHAKALGLSASVFESFRAGCDIDEPGDLAEVLIHSSRRTAEVLRSLGFSLHEGSRGGCNRIFNKL